MSTTIPKAAIDSSASAPSPKPQPETPSNSLASDDVTVTSSKPPSSSPINQLKHLLSPLSTHTHTHTHTPSSTYPLPSLKIIGLGTAGTVFSIPSSPPPPALALKKGGPESPIWTDFNLTNRAHNAFIDTRSALKEAFPDVPAVRVPLCYEFFPEERGEEEEENDKGGEGQYVGLRMDRFPRTHRSQRAMFTVERIPPVAKTARDALVDLYFEDEDEDGKEGAKREEENEDCLVRVYLGEREEAVSNRSYRYETTLRNFPMRLDRWEDVVGEDGVRVLARQMAVGMAVLHWRAKVDGMDVEFVLGGGSEQQQQQQQQEQTMRVRGYDELGTRAWRVRYEAAPAPVAAAQKAVEMWILDFDKASPAELTEEDVKKRLVPAFLGNDPYYPLPKKGEEELWGVWRETYLRASEVLLGEAEARERVVTDCKTDRLPGVFVEEVERRVKENEGWDAEREIVFA
ncbi:MAG: hypothetical protein Q9208_006533 [Pyrenodesmia sp. 3 TL-2023]